MTPLFSIFTILALLRIATLMHQQQQPPRAYVPKVDTSKNTDPWRIECERHRQAKITSKKAR